MSLYLHKQRLDGKVKGVKNQNLSKVWRPADRYAMDMVEFRYMNGPPVPIVLSPPGVAQSIQISVYLPTRGKEIEFVQTLSKLSSCLSEMKELYPDSLVYLRGDFNTSRTNISRTGILEYFITSNNFSSVPINHTTYHHFVRGDGRSDSHLDRLLFSAYNLTSEELTTIVCKMSNPLVNSHHDILVSSVNLPLAAAPHSLPNPENLTAPRVENLRRKIVWSESGIRQYKDIVSVGLQHIQDLWLDPPTTSSLHVALQSTNIILSRAACVTNKSIELGKQYTARSAPISKEIEQSQKTLLKKHRHIQSFSGSPQNKTGLLDEYRKAKSDHRRLERFHSLQDSAMRDSKLISILSNSTDVYKRIKSSKNNQSKIHTLQVGHNTYIGKDVPDGMYHNISQLKSVNTEPSLSSQPFFHDFDLIMNLCLASSLPPISFQKSGEILHNMKASVTDMYSITGIHYIHAGPVGLKHFHMLLSGLIMDINSISLTEINTVYAMVLFKGHGKDKTSDRSYRTISTCPLVAKALDLYVRDLNLDKWNQDQAPTQFQGEGSSHELAAILFA